MEALEALDKATVSAGSWATHSSIGWSGGSSQKSLVFWLQNRTGSEVQIW
jgi:hypothetical protein